jgi:hypothetical protein
MDFTVYFVYYNSYVFINGGNDLVFPPDSHAKTYGCLIDVISRIADHPNKKLQELLPANWGK